jgi:hypothetical protein
MDGLLNGTLYYASFEVLCNNHKILINVNYEKEASCLLVAGYKISEKSASYVSCLEVADSMFL